jgi:hypothetical protein
VEGYAIVVGGEGFLAAQNSDESSPQLLKEGVMFVVEKGLETAKTR